MTTPIEHAARAENPSESAILQGHKAKTPIIAGSVSGACVLLAWTIGFIIFFMRRRKQRQRARQGGYKSHRDIVDFVPVPNATTFIIPPDPALVGPRVSYENQIRDSEHQGQFEKSPTSEAHLRAPDRSEEGMFPSPVESSQSGSITDSIPMITTVGPSTGEISMAASNYPMLDPPARLPPAPLGRKTPADRRK